MDTDYIGKWLVEDEYADPLEIAETIILVDKSPTEYDFTVGDVYNEAIIRGFSESDINVALMNVLVNKYAIMDGNEIVGFE